MVNRTPGLVENGTVPGSEMKCLLGVFMAGNMFVYERNVLDCMHCKVDLARI